MSRAIEELRSMEHGVIPFLGSGKMGKSCALHTLADMLYPKRRKVMIETVEIDLSAFPGYEVVSSVDDVPPDSIAIIEDMARTFNSRSSSNKSTLQEWVGAISHKGILVMFTVQSLADADIAFLRSQNVIHVHKLMHSEDLRFERPEIRSQQTIANLRIMEESQKHPEKDLRSFCYVPRYDEVLCLPIVPWWTRNNSHFLREVKVCSKK